MNLKKLFDNKSFNKCFFFSKEISEDDIVFLVYLFSKYEKLIKVYKEETLEANFMKIYFYW